MSIPNSEYAEMARKAAPPSRKIRNCLRAFLTGGLICALGQGIRALYLYIGLSEKTANTSVPVTLIILTAILTGTGIFDRIAKFAGAGTIVPITGFANSVVAPALEYSSEGRILGTGAQMFRIAGPVLIYGSAATVAYGVIFSILQK